MSDQPIFIAGFHRSGTSAVARILAHAGLDFGTNLLGADPDNPHGHFEDLDVIAAHDAALEADGLTWKSTEPCVNPRPALATFVDSFRPANVDPEATWAIKDPRLCLFLGDWLAKYPTGRVLHVVRSPGAAIRSLHRRHARRYVDTRRVDPSDIAFWQNPDLGLQLWVHYTETLLQTLASHPGANILTVNFDDRDSLEALPATCGTAWQLELDPGVTNALDSKLGLPDTRHPPIEIRDPTLLQRAVELSRTVQI